MISRDPQTRRQEEVAVPVDDKEVAFRKVLDVFPVGPNMESPGLRECRIFTAEHPAYCYKRWRRQQYVMRVNEIVGEHLYFPWHL